MGFYDLSPEKRKELVKKIEKEIDQDLKTDTTGNVYKYGSDSDTYIRKTAYQSLGKIYQREEDLRGKILDLMDDLLKDENDKVRQNAVYALGEIGKKNGSEIFILLQKVLEDESSSVRNAVIGALKQMGQKNPKPTLEFARKYLHHSNPKIRREIVHGMELRGRTYPEDVIPLLEELQDEKDKEVRKTIIHVLGQISYKKGCLEKVVASLKTWKNQELINEALKEIVVVHERYKKFAAKSPEETLSYIKANFNFYE